jgi:FkbM family methyltransferase
MLKAARHTNVVSWAWSALRERRHFKDWSSWTVDFRNRLLMVTKARRAPVLPIKKVRHAALEQPVFVRLGNTDLWVLSEIFVGNEYKAVVEADLGDVRQIVDLGTNAGISIRYWLKRWPDAQIIGVEPDGENYKVARLNADQHRGGAGVKLIKACVAGEEKMVMLDRSAHESMYSMKDAGGAPLSSQEGIPAYPLEKILVMGGSLPMVDLLKVDIEGAEQEVFASCEPWIKRVRHMVLEVHPPYTTEQLLADCERNGQRFKIIERHASPPNEVVFLAADR